MWAAQVDAFVRARTVITYDLLGHGGSPRIAGQAELALWMLQLERVLGALEAGRCSIVGFSFGGLIAQAFALSQPQRLERLVILSSVYDRSPEERARVGERLAAARAEGPGAIIRAAIERWFSPAFIAGNAEVIGAIERRLGTNDPESFLAAYATFAAADRELAGRLHAIAVPTLVMTGELDQGSTPDMARRMAAAVPGARLEIVPGGRHMMPIELADRVNLAIARFLLTNDPDGKFL
jgi:pimeloyl-ACP methyl ester carboxylesterase